MHSGAFSPGARSGNAARVYDETATVRGDALALETERRRYSHAELRDRSARVAGALHEHGLAPDDRLCLFLSNRPELVLTALAALKAGLPFSPANPQFTARELVFQLADSDARALVTEPSLLPKVAEALDRLDTDPLVILVDDSTDETATDGDAATTDEAADATDDIGFDFEFDFDTVAFSSLDADSTMVHREDDDVAMQPYTSGTTGKPKGVLLTHRNLRAQSFMAFERSALRADEERFLSILPLAHIAGFVNRTWQPLIRGAAVYLRDPSEWDPETAMATIERERITKFGAVTAMYVDIVNHERFGEYDLSSLEEVMEGGDRLPTSVQERFETTAGVELFEAYGLTETGGGTHVGFGSTFGPRLGTIGQPLRATDCKLVDEEGREVPPGETGQLLVRGPHVMKGYHERPAETAEAFTDDGYFRTGDVARRDADNYYELVDRMSDVIVTAGYTVYPREIENALYEHPDVVDAAVVGVPDERRTETVKAYVVRRQGSAVDADRIRAFCLERVAPYKHPRTVEFVEELPRTHNSKVRRVELREGT
ncbi:AMP-dependent synthetase [Haloprofundus marisrubri]|uniref:AMP-dependent synthetase n=1 Tax=Haloprofundus marisrubri TaxID=1514971 RepID=A0A0W1R6Q6_9EURY|nr:AMP-binding protein [Haloprofundus marisrubri]KTG08880.1 AMP-dependent synthetase [Haloprofundus marisrubri]